MQESLWAQGIDLMLFGMGTVFVFLTLLVIVTMIMSAIVSKYLAEDPDAELASVPNANSAAPVSKTTLAVIQAAIQAHRSKQ